MISISICKSDQSIYVCYNMQSDVAKKPYNPILGEVFRCYVDAPGTSRVPLDRMSEVKSVMIITVMYVAA